MEKEKQSLLLQSLDFGSQKENTRIINVLSLHAITSVDELCAMTEKKLLNRGKIGPVTVAEIKVALEKIGRSLAPS